MIAAYLGVEGRAGRAGRGREKKKSDANEETALACSGVTTYYGKIIALREVDVEVNEGEIVTLIGANGAGKSTG